MKNSNCKLKRAYESVHVAKHGPGVTSRDILIGSLFFIGTNLSERS